MATATKNAPKSAPVIDRAPIVTTTVEKNKSMVVTVGHQDYIKLTKSKDGMPILKFSAGQNDRNNADTECQWHNIVMFGDAAVEAFNSIGQGDLIRIFGSLKASEYTSKTGLSAVYFSISTYSLKVIEKASSNKPDAQTAEVEVVTADDFPF